MHHAGLIPNFSGVLWHDDWSGFAPAKSAFPPSMAIKPHYTFDGCDQSLCNAHHLRELERTFEQDN